MQTPFAFDTMLLFGFLSGLLLLGIILRARLSFLQRFLFPGCLIGGAVGLLLTASGTVRFPSGSLESLAYHSFNISFISVGLTADPRSARRPRGYRRLMGGSAWMALVQGITFPMQAIIGGLGVLLCGALGMNLFPTFGFLAPLGFNEGPGQALSFGKVWEGAGFEHAATIGLAFAAVGYLFAFFVGVPLANRGVRARRNADTGPAVLPSEVLTGVYGRHQDGGSAGRLTLHPANVDNLAFQAALVGLVYLVTYGLVSMIGRLMPPDAASMLWGFFFFFGLAVALLLRGGLTVAGGAHLIDPGIQRRITGWAVDFLIVATVVAIQFPVLRQFIVPILLIALSCGLATTIVVVGLGRGLTDYSLERTAAIYGVVTGTVSCGLLLLRIVDPDFRTPAAMEIALMNVLVLPVIAGCTVLVNAPLWWGWSIGSTLGVYFCLAAVCLGLIRVLQRRSVAARDPDPGI